MDEEDHKRCENWVINFIDQYRKRYETLPEHIRKYISRLENFNPPCQVIVIVLPNQKITYLWLKKDPDLPDKDIKCYRSTNQEESKQITKRILSDKDMNKMFTHEPYSQTKKISWQEIIEPQLIEIFKLINRVTPELDMPKEYFLGRIYTMPMNGFSWIMYEDIMKREPETIINYLINTAVAEYKCNEAKTDEVPASEPNKEELVKGYSTYFYPPLWIGKKPTFDFSSKVNGMFILPFNQTSMYKGKLVSFNQEGFFFIESENNQQYLRYMNEIIGTAILLEHNFDIISDADIGETWVTKDKGETRSLTTPRSVTRSRQAHLDIRTITEDVINTYQQITVKDLLIIIKTAENVTKDPVASDFIIFFARASQYLREGKYKEAFLFDWLIIERGMRIEWKNYLKAQVMNGSQPKNIKNREIYYVIRDLSKWGIINAEQYNSIIKLKGLRNRLYHMGGDIQKSEEIKCHQISEWTIRNKTNIK